MKMKYWALSLLACGGMLACTNDEVAENNGKEEGTEVSYLAVNVMNTVGPGTARAGEVFENGNDDENAITTIRFYFFDAAGNAFNVSGTNNYKDFVPTSTTPGDEGDNVEEITNAILVLDKVSGSVPVSMVAVVNPPASLTGNKTLSQLQAVVDGLNGATSGSFVMSNSVYAEGGESICATSVGSHLKDSQESAEADPVDVYVERVLAKVTVTLDDPDKDADSYCVAGTSGGDDAIYAKVVGWQVADYKTQSYLLKQINPAWTDETIGIIPWSSTDYHRSYWATSVAGNVTNGYSWSDISNGGLLSQVYTQENTPASAVTSTETNDLTKVIVAVQLVDADDNPSPRYQYLGASYASEEDILNLIMPNFNDYYIKTAESTYSPITKDEVEFKTGTALGSGDSYRVYPQLKTSFDNAMEGEETKLYTKSEENYTEADKGTVNTALKSYNAQIWTQGRCYYYTTIPHLAASGTGTYGVVRNHVYKINITDIQGFGTPVYDPTPEEDGDDETIDPVTPTDDASYLAAKINILSWRVVSKDVTLGGE